MRDPNYRVLLTTLVAVVYSGTLWAQDPPAPNRRPPEEELPIDQYLQYLLLVGLAFGLYWAYKQIKSQRSRD